MLYEELPSFIRQSTIFTDTDKYKLSKIHELPTELEVDNFRLQPAIQELTNTFIGDDSTRDIHLQEKAKEYLSQDDILSAWKVILL
ncbi:hypothetical protein [Sphingobacterium bovistauri]|uniref:Uncharacterized protein n=1 Tax=Sphingobacterium bovistauri TaxID=2781959 RepID=A0ABS7Z5R1_9SPHI|nr:hypothetical protein [Sphingobacterium bovistauri]MCA5005526.1 hypothetical protein [Sphingobacterium bovistauri]